MVGAILLRVILKNNTPKQHSVEWNDAKCTAEGYTIWCLCGEWHFVKCQSA